MSSSMNTRLHEFMVLLFISPATSQLTWIQPESPVFPNGHGNERMVSGYYDGSAYLIGGIPGHFDVLEYTKYNYYTKHNDVTDYIITGSQQFTTIEDTIYIYSYEQLESDGSAWIAGPYIMTYNMATHTYDGDAITKKNRWLLHPCITNYHSEYIFVVGGHTSVDQRTLQIFDLKASLWLSDGPTMATPRRGHSCNVHNNELYTIGGISGATLLDTVQILDVSDIPNINTLNWIELGGTLSVAREVLRSVVHADFIYVLGGYAGGNPSLAVDVIDTITKSIVSDSNLKTGGVVSPVIMADTNTLFVFGGYVSDVVDTLQYSAMPPTNAPTDAPTLSPTSRPTNQPSTSPSDVPTTSNPTVPPTQNPTLYPTTSPTRNPTSNPNHVPTTLPTKNPTAQPTADPSAMVAEEWVYKDSLNCPDGFRDLNDDNSWYGVYCEKCSAGTAGTYGQCDKCGVLEEPNHTRTECEFSSPWWLYLLETVGGLTFIVALGMFVYKKVWNNGNTDESNQPVADGENEPIAANNSNIQMQRTQNMNHSDS
eukprot:82509_1